MAKDPKELEQQIKAQEHDITDAAEGAPQAAEAAAEVLHGIEQGVVGAYKKVESTVVGAYKAVEGGVVGAYKAVEDAIVGKVFAKPGESVEDAKKRLSGENKK